MSELADLIPEKLQRELQESFAYATGFGVVFVDKEGRHIGEGSNFSRFCRAINADPKDGARCQCSNKNAIRIALKEGRPGIYICHAGLVNIEIPLTLDGELIGAITAGQVICEGNHPFPQDEQATRQLWRENELYASYYREIPILSLKQIQETARALQNFSNYILQQKSYTQIQEHVGHLTDKLLKNQKKLINLKNQLALARFEALQKQIMPHFTFNVLNSISRLMSMKKNDQAQEMLESFSSMLRYALSRPAAKVTLKQELDYIRHYLRIQRYRFGENLAYHIDCDKKSESLTIPFFSLQPFVENALEHGILNPTHKYGGELDIVCRAGISAYTIEIRDSGAGMDENTLGAILEELASKRLPRGGKIHIGMSNCFKRLRMFFGARCTIAVKSSLGCGTTIAITIKNKR